MPSEYISPPNLAGIGATVPAVTLLGRADCHLCLRARALLAPLCASLGLTFQERSIAGDAELTAAYGERIPVALLDGIETLAWPFTLAQARAALTEVESP